MSEKNINKRINKSVDDFFYNSDSNSDSDYNITKYDIIRNIQKKHPDLDKKGLQELYDVSEFIDHVEKGCFIKYFDSNCKLKGFGFITSFQPIKINNIKNVKIFMKNNDRTWYTFFNKFYFFYKPKINILQEKIVNSAFITHQDYETKKWYHNRIKEDKNTKQKRKDDFINSVLNDGMKKIELDKQQQINKHNINEQEYYKIRLIGKK